MKRLTPRFFEESSDRPRRARIGAAATLLGILLTAVPECTHDLFLDLPTYFVSPHSDVTISLFKYAVEPSEFIFGQAQMLDLRIVGPDSTIVHPDATQWRDHEQTAVLDFRTGDTGTYVVGISSASGIVEFTGEDFNAHLEYSGFLDHLNLRRAQGTLDEPATVRHSVYAKAVMQVGGRLTDTFSYRLGYPIEIIPLNNPYSLTMGDSLYVRVLLRDAPLGSQLVYASYEGHNDLGEDGELVEAVQTAQTRRAWLRSNLQPPVGSMCVWLTWKKETSQKSHTSPTGLLSHLRFDSRCRVQSAGCRQLRYRPMCKTPWTKSKCLSAHCQKMGRLSPQVGLE